MNTITAETPEALEIVARMLATEEEPAEESAPFLETPESEDDDDDDDEDDEARD